MSFPQPDPTTALRVPEWVWSAVVDYCSEVAVAHGEEACGVLVARQTDMYAVVDWLRLVNVAEFPRYRYALDPDEQVKVWTGLDLAGLHPRVVFHSHLVKGPELSPTDVRYALPQHHSIGHLVVALERADHALWWVVDGQVTRGPLKIEPTDVTRDLTREPFRP